MSDVPTELVPFGKYANQPIEVLATDPRYVNWLVNQPGIRERYSWFYNILINNFCVPADTPAHNVLQAQFLQPDWRLKTALCTVGVRDPTDAAVDYAHALFKRENSWDGDGGSRSAWDIEIVSADCCNFFTRGGRSPYGWSTGQHWACHPIAAHNMLAVPAAVDFETASGIDVQFVVRGWLAEGELLIEIKPSLGDDYPTVLRQVRRSGANCLYVGSFRSDAIDVASLRAIFATAGVVVVFAAEVAQMQMPAMPPVAELASAIVVDLPAVNRTNHHSGN